MMCMPGTLPTSYFMYTYIYMGIVMGQLVINGCICRRGAVRGDYVCVY